MNRCVHEHIIRNMCSAIKSFKLVLHPRNQRVNCGFSESVLLLAVLSMFMSVHSWEQCGGEAGRKHIGPIPARLSLTRSEHRGLTPSGISVVYRGAIPDSHCRLTHVVPVPSGGRLVAYKGSDFIYRSIGCFNSLRPSEAFMRQKTNHHWFK